MGIIKRVIRVISYLIAIALSIFLAIALYGTVKQFIFLIIAIPLAGVGFPLMIRHGIKTVNNERNLVFEQLQNNEPVKINKARTLCGFFEILLLLWLVIPLIMLIPGGLYFIVLPIITLLIIIIENSVAKSWEEIGWSKALYRLMNVSFYILGILLGLIIGNIIY